MNQRAGGILLPVFSLPGRYGIGCFSKEAYAFVDFLKKAGQKYWQILPIGPTSYGDSPYQSFSTFAGNPYFIDLEALIREGLLSREECDRLLPVKREDDIDYGQLYQSRFELLYRAYQKSSFKSDPSYQKFLAKNSEWLPDYALFMALKDAAGGKSFYEWDKPLVHREGNALSAARKEHADRIDFYQFLQYEFSLQWTKLKDYANAQGISIIGDIPIYVAEDSADVWASPQLFQMDADGRPSGVAGCPPDGFSATGQRWGNPLYDWEYHEKTGFSWWIRRIRRCRELYDVIRIDHFRGFDEYYAIPSSEQTAINGKWMPGPGMKLFSAIRKELGQVPIIAEDLGFMTDTVRKLVKDSGYPNMKVLEFAFDGRNLDESGNAVSSSNEYLPHFYDKNCVVYTGTHDNETVMGWLGSIRPQEKSEAREYLGLSRFASDRTIAKRLVRLAVSSTANTCVIPMQDYLLLDNRARINTPSTLGGNWRWRLKKRQLSDRLAESICHQSALFGR